MSRQQLTKEDWAEIYYALDSKWQSPTCVGDGSWQRHLRRIMDKIGPDGSNMVEEDEGLSLYDKENEKSVPVRVEENDATGSAIFIGIEGYRDYYYADEIIMLSIDNGTLILRAWADKNEEDPTHTITFEKAKE